MSEHSTFWMGNKPADFCFQMQQSKEINQSQMEAIIQKRKEAKKYFKTLSTALKLVEQNIKKLADDNHLHLSGMMSHLEVSKLNIPKDETAKSFCKKVKESSDILKQELVDVQQLDDNYLTGLKETKICIDFKDADGDFLPSYSSLFENGLNSPTRSSDKELEMLPIASFILISALINERELSIESSSADASTSSTPEPRVAKMPRLDGEFDIRRSVFILFFSDGVDEVGWNGRVCVAPSQLFDEPFLQELGQLCLTPTPFGGQIIKVCNINIGYYLWFTT